MQFDDLVSFLECIGVYSNPYFDLELAETLPPNRVAGAANWLWKLMMEMFWNLCDGLDELYMMC